MCIVNKDETQIKLNKKNQSCKQKTGAWYKYTIILLKEYFLITGAGFGEKHLEWFGKSQSWLINMG